MARAGHNGEALEDGQQNCDFNGQKFSSHSKLKICVSLSLSRTLALSLSVSGLFLWDVLCV